MENTHYGDEDPDCVDDPETEEEQFSAAKHLGGTPEDMKDREFAAKFAKWLEAASSEG